MEGLAEILVVRRRRVLKQMKSSLPLLLLLLLLAVVVVVVVLRLIDEGESIDTVYTLCYFFISSCVCMCKERK